MRIGAVFWSVILLSCLAWIGLDITSNPNRIDTDVTAVFALKDSDDLEIEATRHLFAQNKRLLQFSLGHDDPDILREAGRRFAAELSSLPSLTWVNSPMGHASRLQPLIDVYRDHAGILLPPAARQALTDGDGEALFQDTVGTYFSPAGYVDAAQVARDPFLLTDAYLQWLARQTGQPQTMRQTDGRYAIIISAAMESGDNNMVAEESLAPEIETLIQSVRQAHPGLTVDRTGALFFSLAQSDRARTEIQTILTVATVGIVLLTFVVFRSTLPLLGILLVVLSGLITGTATVLSLFDNLHLFASVFGTSLIGVVVDYGFHYFAHAGESSTRRFRAGLTLGMATSVMGFLCLGASPVAILGQIAVYSAAGLVGAYCTVLLLLPVILPNDRRRLPERLQAIRPAAIRHTALLEDRRTIWIGGTTVMALLLLGLSLFEPMDDLRSLGRTDPDLAAQAQRISQLSNGDTETYWLAVEGATLQELLQREEYLKDLIQAADANATVIGLSDFLPSDARQQENARLTLNGLIGPFGSRLTALTGIPVNAIPQKQEIHLDDIIGLLPPQIEGLIISHSASGYRHLMQLRGAQPAIVEELDFATLVEPTKSLTEQLEGYRVSAYWALLLAIVLASLLALWRYGLRLGARVVAVPGIATSLAFVLPGLWGANHNFFTAMALFLVFAICADYALFFGETKAEDREKSYLAVTLSAISSGLAFGLLSTSSIPLVQDIGQVVLIGVISAWGLAPLALSVGRFK